MAKGKKRLEKVKHSKVEKVEEEVKVKHHKKHHTKHKPKEEHFYVRLEEPKELRRDILHAAIEATQILKGYERVKKIKDEKRMYKDKLRKTMREVSALLTHLKRTEMPMYSEVKEEIKKEGLVLKRGWDEVEKRLAESEKKAKEEREMLAKGLEKPKVVEPPVSNLDRDIMDIKEKLRNLNI